MRWTYASVKRHGRPREGSQEAFLRTSAPWHERKNEKEIIEPGDGNIDRGNRDRGVQGIGAAIYLYAVVCDCDECGDLLAADELPAVRGLYHRCAGAHGAG